jgi:solute carrier family 25 iron transporter 28/37
MTPFDTVKQRMQLGHYNNVWHCIRTIMGYEGIVFLLDELISDVGVHASGWWIGGLRTLYRSFPTTLTMNVPYGCIMVAVNESMRKVLADRFNSKDAVNRHSVANLLISGSVAGGVASFLTTPMDIIKTRLQVQNLQPCPRFPTISSSGAGPVTGNQSRGFSTAATYSTGLSSSTRGPLQIVSKILKEDGFRGFFRGAVPRIMVQVPSVAVSWTTYDTIKGFFLTEESN